MRTEEHIRTSGLPEADRDFLIARRIACDITVDGGMTNVLLFAWALPPGLNIDSADLLIRLPGGYPDVAPDMWWFDPPVLGRDGRSFPGTDAQETHVGRVWQRWSRHFQAGQWQSGADGLESYLALIRGVLGRSAGEAIP